MINCLIVDDEPLAQEILQNHIQQYPGLNLQACCSTTSTAFEVLHFKPVDLIFLDIKMPGMSGLDFIAALKNPPAVIFTTAFSEYAAASYELDAVDYLLKPITFERFSKSLDKYHKNKPVPVEEVKEYSYFKVSGTLVKVEHKDILYAQSIKDYLIIFTEKENLIVHMTMKYLTELLPPGIFIRIHRSYLVNLHKLHKIGKGEIKIGEVSIPVGESYRLSFAEASEKIT